MSSAWTGWHSQYQNLVRDAQQPRGPQTLLAVSVEAIRRGHLGVTEVARWYDEVVTVLREQLNEAGIDRPEAARQAGRADGWDEDAPLFPETTSPTPETSGEGL